MSLVRRHIRHDDDAPMLSKIYTANTCGRSDDIYKVYTTKQLTLLNPDCCRHFSLTSKSTSVRSKMPSIPGFLTNTPLHPSFDKDIRDTHLIYDYDAQDENGNPEKWRYEMWFFSENRIVYAIHGGT